MAEFVHQKYTVLIESDWNLKYSDMYLSVMFGNVLIESDWNLKILNGVRLVG